MVKHELIETMPQWLMPAYVICVVYAKGASAASSLMCSRVLWFESP